jgi:hypothetical protein
MFDLEKSQESQGSSALKTEYSFTYCEETRIETWMQITDM